MNSMLRCALSCLMVTGIVSFFAACDDGGGGGNSTPDVGDNDINTVLCVGDSITDGGCAPAGAPYPSRLAGLSGKRVANEGICGSTSGTGASRIGSLLKRNKPGYVCILYGINDVDFGYSHEALINNLRSMVVAAKNNKSVPIIATLMPTYDSHAFARGSVSSVNVQIRQMAKEEKARLVDLEKEFGDNRDFIQSDGLHPSDSGTQLIALGFNDRI